MKLKIVQIAKIGDLLIKLGYNCSTKYFIGIKQNKDTITIWKRYIIYNIMLGLKA